VRHRHGLVDPVVLRLFRKAFAGILVTDFWGVYNAIVSADGADTQAILMSVFQTLKQNKANITKNITNALHHHLKTKHLPKLAVLLENSAE